jgi:hypothetical protein
MPDGDPFARPALRLAFPADGAIAPIPIGETRALRALRLLDDDVLREYGLESDAGWGLERLAERSAGPTLDLVGEVIEISAA